MALARRHPRQRSGREQQRRGPAHETQRSLESETRSVHGQASAPLPPLLLRLLQWPRRLLLSRVQCETAPALPSRCQASGAALRRAPQRLLPLLLRALPAP